MLWDRQHGLRDQRELPFDARSRARYFLGQAGGLKINNHGEILGSAWDRDAAVDRDVIFTPYLLADMNCDGRVDSLDVEGFVLALIDLEAFEETYPDCRHFGWAADCNQDGAIDNFDIEPFITCLMDGCRLPPAPPTGRCCLPDETCVVVSREVCESYGGLYRGDATRCDVWCFGSCCTPTGGCVIIDERRCDPFYSGVYGGDGTSCDGAPCRGACCLPDGSCLLLREDDCIARGGEYQGGGTVCTPGLCDD